VVDMAVDLMGTRLCARGVGVATTMEMEEVTGMVSIMEEDHLETLVVLVDQNVTTVDHLEVLLDQVVEVMGMVSITEVDPLETLGVPVDQSVTMVDLLEDLVEV